MDRQLRLLPDSFLSAWYINRERLVILTNTILKISQKMGWGSVFPYSSGPKPIYRAQVGKTVYQNLINQATDYVYITTPYLIADYDLTESIKNTALRGVDVRIVTPCIPDKKVIQLVTRGAYPDLLSAGVRIYEYSPDSFIASKYLSMEKWPPWEPSILTIGAFTTMKMPSYFIERSLSSLLKGTSKRFFKFLKKFIPTIKTSWYQSLVKELSVVCTHALTINQDLAQGWIFFLFSYE